MTDLMRAWLASAEMDIESIQQIIDNEFLTPVACFHAQQSVEKCLKAFLEHQLSTVPKSHDILNLYGRVCQYVDLSLDLVLLQKLNDLYIEARYPGDLGLLPDGKPSVSVAKDFYRLAQELYVFMEEQLDALSSGDKGSIK